MLWLNVTASRRINTHTHTHLRRHWHITYSSLTPIHPHTRTDMHTHAAACSARHARCAYATLCSARRPSLVSFVSSVRHIQSFANCSHCVVPRFPFLVLSTFLSNQMPSALENAIEMSLKWLYRLIVDPSICIVRSIASFGLSSCCSNLLMSAVIKILCTLSADLSDVQLIILLLFPFPIEYHAKLSSTLQWRACVHLCACVCVCECVRECLCDFHKDRSVGPMHSSHSKPKCRQHAEFHSKQNVPYNPRKHNFNLEYTLYTYYYYC